MMHFKTALCRTGIMAACCLTIFGATPVLAAVTCMQQARQACMDAGYDKTDADRATNKSLRADCMLPLIANRPVTGVSFSAGGCTAAAAAAAVAPVVAVVPVVAVLPVAAAPPARLATQENNAVDTRNSVEGHDNRAESSDQSLGSPGRKYNYMQTLDRSDQN